MPRLLGAAPSDALLTVFLADPATDACVNSVTDLVEKYSPDLAGETKGQAVYTAALAIGCGRDPDEPATRTSRR